MKITITLDARDGIKVSRDSKIVFESRTDARTAEETAALVAKIVGIAVAEAITATTGGE